MWDRLEQLGKVKLSFEDKGLIVTCAIFWILCLVSFVFTLDLSYLFQPIIYLTVIGIIYCFIKNITSINDSERKLWVFRMIVFGLLHWSGWAFLILVVFPKFI